MGVTHSKEPDPDRAREIAERGCILRSVVGSTVHGLSNPGTDDRDEMGVCLEPREYVIGLRPFDHWVFRTQPEGIPSGPGDLDLTIYGLRKYGSAPRGNCAPRRSGGAPRRGGVAGASDSRQRAP